MPRTKKQPEPEQQAGAPEWMVTFSDCMTLLLTFFVLLLSFSSFDDRDYFRQMNKSFAQQFSFKEQRASEKESLVLMPVPNENLHWGSEKPTLDEGVKDQFKKQTPPADFLRLNTFLISSDQVFWGKGAVLSKNGRAVLTDLALFAGALPGYLIIVSESGSQDTYEADSIGCNRAWAVFEYLTHQQGLARDQVSLSAGGTAVKEYHLNNMRREKASANERMLEIVLLKRDI